MLEFLIKYYDTEPNKKFAPLLSKISLILRSHAKHVREPEKLRKKRPRRDHPRKKRPELHAEKEKTTSPRNTVPPLNGASDPHPHRETQSSPRRGNAVPPLNGASDPHPHRETQRAQPSHRASDPATTPIQLTPGHAELSHHTDPAQTHTHVMLKGKEKMSDSNQFDWLSPKNKIMLKILAQEAAKDNKPSSTSRESSSALVAKKMTVNYKVKCDPSYVDNQMQTLKNMWSTIEKFRNKSGFVWDDEKKMITCTRKILQEEVRMNQKRAMCLNAKIDMYDELAIVMRKDRATSGFSKSYVDIENEPDNGDSAEFVADNVEEDVVEKEKNAIESSATGSGISKPRKRECAPSNANNSVLTDLSDQLKEIVVALKEIAVTLKEINRGPGGLHSSLQ